MERNARTPRQQARFEAANRRAQEIAQDRHRRIEAERMANAPEELTLRQREALAWMESVGKASERLVRRHGFAVRTLDALADKDLVFRVYMPQTFGGNFKVYRSKTS